jgi:hypothetical protein
VFKSYYEAITKFATYFTAVLDALEFVDEIITDCDQHIKFLTICPDFAFWLLLMQDVLGVMNELSLALDREDLEAEKCMALLQESKNQLQVMRDEGWTNFLNKVGLLCSAR